MAEREPADNRSPSLEGIGETLDALRGIIDGLGVGDDLYSWAYQQGTEHTVRHFQDWVIKLKSRIRLVMDALDDLAEAPEDPTLAVVLIAALLELSNMLVVDGIALHYDRMASAVEGDAVRLKDAGRATSIRRS